MKNAILFFLLATFSCFSQTQAEIDAIKKEYDVNKINELKELRNNKDCTIYFFDDFEELKSIKDNYYLFVVENVIMNLADIKCSTFNVPDNKYHCYLTNTAGWQ
jgi:hypothetical protein